MPDLTTHYLFGEKVLEEVSSDLHLLLERNRTVFNYGLQGPDLFFFHKLWQGMFSGKNKYRTCGNFLHNKKVAQTLNFMKHYTEDKRAFPEEYQVLRAYYLGFVCHYYLDKAVHPYVYFMVDSVCRVHPERSPYSVHFKLEAELDAFFYELFKKERVTTFSVREHFSLDCRPKNILAKLYSELLLSVFDIPVTVEEIMRCFDGLAVMSRILYDDTGLLVAATNAVGRVFPKVHDASNHLKPKTFTGDIANLSGNLWHHPRNPSRKSRQSVLTLFQDAKLAVVPVLEYNFAHMDGSDVEFDTSLNFNGNTEEAE